MFRVSRERVFIAVKLVLTISIFILVFGNLHLGNLTDQIRALPLWLIILVVACVIVQIVLFAPLRVHLVLGALGFKIPLKMLMKISWSAYFFEQAGLNFVGGDLARVLLLNRIGIPKVFAAEGLIIDRIIGVGCLLILSFIGLPTLLRGLPPAISNQAVYWLEVLCIVAAVGVALLMFGLGLHRVSHWRAIRFVRDSLRRLLSLTTRKSLLPTVFGIAFFTHLLNVIVFYVIGVTLGIPLSFGEWLMLVPSALFLSMLPISVAGWGIREGAFIFALGTHGVEPTIAIVPSVLYGLSVLAASLPGGLVWLFMRRSSLPFAKRADPSELSFGAPLDPAAKPKRRP